MNNEKLVSVVIPTYSRPTLLERTINSILNQTYKNIEIIVVDDNNPNTDSRKETELIMEKYKNNSKVIYLQHDRNRNGSAARNTGWKHSSGEYITFVDDDDELSNDKIEEQVNCLENLENDWGACYTAYRIIKQKGKKQISSENRQGNCYIDALMRTMFMGSGSNLLLRKEVVDKINGYDESFIRNQDIEFPVRVTQIAYVNKCLLTIYQDGVRKERTLEEIEQYTDHYLNRFKDDINKLNSKDKERVISVITLERCKVAFIKKNISYGIRLLKKNKIKIKYTLRYIYYIIYRSITGKSFGFNGYLKVNNNESNN